MKTQYQNAKGATFTFGGIDVGGVESFSLLEGQVRAATFRPLSGPPSAHPSYPDYGQCVLNLYRSESDAGQAALLSSLRNRTRATMVVTHPSGEAETFTAFTLMFPTRGSKSSGQPVELTRCVLRVSGAVT